MSKIAFKEAYRAVRLCLAKKDWPEMSEAAKNLTMDAATLRCSSVRRFGVEASKTAPDFRIAVRVNLKMVKYRRAIGFTGNGYRLPC